MKLPPDDSDDVTPAEAFIKTVDVSSMVTRDVGGIKTAKLPPRDGHSLTTVDGRITLDTLVRGRLGARDVAFKECKAACKVINRTFRRGLAIGAGAMLGLGGIVGACWKWWRAHH